MKKLVSGACAMLAISGTALAATIAYDTGVYSGTTAQNSSIAMQVSKNKMDQMSYYANFSCKDNKGKKATLTNHHTALGSAKIDSNQKVKKTYKLQGGDVVHLDVTLDHAKADGTFTEALQMTSGGHVYQCVTPGGHAGNAGKVHFTMKWQHS